MAPTNSSYCSPQLCGSGFEVGCLLSHPERRHLASRSEEAAEEEIERFILEALADASNVGVAALIEE